MRKCVDPSLSHIGPLLTLTVMAWDPWLLFGEKRHFHKQKCPWESPYGACSLQISHDHFRVQEVYVNYFPRLLLFNEWLQWLCNAQFCNEKFSDFLQPSHYRFSTNQKGKQVPMTSFLKNHHSQVVRLFQFSEFCMNWSFIVCFPQTVLRKRFPPFMFLSSFFILTFPLLR